MTMTTVDRSPVQIELDDLIDQRPADQKFSVEEVTTEYRVFATVWATQYEGDFAFMVEMRAAANRRLLSPGQAKGVLNCYRADRLRAAKAATAAPATERRADPEDGFYFIKDGDDVQIFKVQTAVHGSGKRYAKALVPPAEPGAKATFQYEGRAPFALDLQPLTLEQAQSFGHLYGVCCVCGATLTDERSIERGLGPVCGGRF